jgi:hypothetical protein
MAKLTFYRQGRADGAIRTGIELDDEMIFECYEKSGSEVDPTLLWYMDLRCKGSAVPSEAQEARQWLLDHEDVIRAGFLRCAHDFEAGRDVDLCPLLWSEFSGIPDHVGMTIACATNRRIWALSVPKLLEDVAVHWRERIEQMAPAEWVA